MSTKTRIIPLPASSALHRKIEPGDFFDCYFNPTVPESVSVSDATLRALAQMPGWVDFLMRVRNALVAPLGLKTGADAHGTRLEKGDLQTGERLGVFEVQSVTSSEIVLGEQDRHLDFLVSVLRHEGGYALSTWVRTHNLAGRAYLGAVLPFHKLIVRSATARISQADGPD